MTLLEAVNLILPRLGEHPVTSLAIRHPTLAIILPNVEHELRRVLLKGWWFNKYHYKAFPDPEGKITLSPNMLRFVPDSSYQYCAVRNRSLYNTETGSYVFDGPVEGTITEYVPFDECPESCQNAVFYRTLVTTKLTDVGLQPETKSWEAVGRESEAQLESENLEQRRYSTRQSRRFCRIRNAMRG